jgi:hypothetical protein
MLRDVEMDKGMGKEEREREKKRDRDRVKSTVRLDQSQKTVHGLCVTPPVKKYKMF